jgi:hypothetical protein
MGWMPVGDHRRYNEKVPVLSGTVNIDVPTYTGVRFDAKVLRRNPHHPQKEWLTKTIFEVGKDD